MLTFKQSLFIRAYITTFNATEAAMRSYNVKNRIIASTIGYENLRKPEIRVVLDSILKQAGMSEGDIARNLKEKINLHSITGIKFALRLHGYRI